MLLNETNSSQFLQSPEWDVAAPSLLHPGGFPMCENHSYTNCFIGVIIIAFCVILWFPTKMEKWLNSGQNRTSSHSYMMLNYINCARKEEMLQHDLIFASPSIANICKKPNMDPILC